MASTITIATDLSGSSSTLEVEEDAKEVDKLVRSTEGLIALTQRSDGAMVLLGPRWIVSVRELR